MRVSRRRYLDLMASLVNCGLLGSADGELAANWVTDLKTLGYRWPKITQRQAAGEHKVRPIVDGRGDATGVERAVRTATARARRLNQRVPTGWTPPKGLVVA